MNANGRWLLVLALLLPAEALALGECNWATYPGNYRCEDQDIRPPGYMAWDVFSCGTGGKVGSSRSYFEISVGYAGSGCEDAAARNNAAFSRETSCSDLRVAQEEICGNGIDDDLDGCVDNGCEVGVGACKCKRTCSNASCSSPQGAGCTIPKGGSEICGNFVDDDCNGLIDESCDSNKNQNHNHNQCEGNAGNDPILIGSQSAATEPFTDFSFEFVSRLYLERTYNSRDVSVVTDEPGGIFGRGWHHNWEGFIQCEAGVCTVAQGLSGAQFMRSGAAVSLDGSETLEIYVPLSDEVLKSDSHDLLVRRPDGTWILYGVDGTARYFRTQCDACFAKDQATATCPDALQGGRARLVRVEDRAGNGVDLRSDRAAGLLLGIYDDLGHSLEVRGAAACEDGLASELRANGTLVATYAFTDRTLQSAVDADGDVLRSYVYAPGTHGLLQSVKNEAGDLVAEFSYDEQGRAIGLVDPSSSVSVSYDAPDTVSVLEYFRGKDGDTFAGSVRKLDADGNVTSVSDGCACGPAKTRTWTDRRPTCTLDATGHATVQSYDPQGRLTYRIAYAGTSCTPPTNHPADASEEWTGYALTRAVAQGVSIDLEIPTGTARSSAVQAGGSQATEYDYDPGKSTIDPPGYTCATAALPAGSTLCREIESGYVPAASGAVLERHATFFSYDRRGRLVRTYGPVTLDQTAGAEVPPLDERTYWPDDASPERRGRLHELKRYPTPASAPLVTTYDYDLFGVFQVTDERGNVTTTVKDGRGRPRFVVTADGAARETRYHDGTSPRLQLGPTNASVRTTFDGRGRPQIVEWLDRDPEASGAAPVVGRSERYAYDAAGNRIHAERRDAQGAVVWVQDRAFDVQHRVVWESNPDQPSTGRAWGYDASGSLWQTSDEEGRATFFGLDGLNRVQKVWRGTSQGGLFVAEYVYGPHSNDLAQVKAGNTTFTPNGEVGNTAYAHDDFGRLGQLVPAVTDPRTPIVYRHDARGNVTAREGYPPGTTVTYAYDGLDRLTSMSLAGAVMYTYTYDVPPNQGRLTSVRESQRTVTFQYDAVGRKTSETIQEDGIAAPLTTTYGYDAAGALRDVTYPSGLQIRYDRDPATGDVVRVANVTTGTRYADQVVHYPGGPVKALVLGNHQTVAQELTLRYLPRAISSGPVALRYTTTPSGDVSEIADTSLTLSGCPRNTSRSFRYDFLDRLTDSPNWLSYAYDGAGNRTGEQLSGSSVFYLYATDTGEAAYRTDLVRVRATGTTSAPRQTHRFAYDAGRNLSAIAALDGGAIATEVCLRHDAMGRMTTFGTTWPRWDFTWCSEDWHVQAPVARYRYDWQNRRIAKLDVASGRWTYFLFDDAGNPLSELSVVNGQWIPIRDYVWLDGLPLAQIEYPGPTSSEGYVYYFHLDHIGFPRAMTNSAGQLVWNTFPKPYGDLAEYTSTDPLSGRVVVTNLRLPGQYDERLLGPLGLQGPYYNWNRWYLPGVGRYLEPDPIALAGGPNTAYGVDWYNYAGGNPLSNFDSNGLTCQTNWDFFWDWAAGGGQSYRSYFGSGTENDEMQRGLGAEQLRKKFYANHCQDVRDCYGTFKAYWDTIANPSTRELCSTTAQVGGFCGSVHLNGDGTATFRIANTAGTYSFFLHAVPDRQSPTGPMRNIYQEFVWTEKVDQCKCSG